MVKDVNLNDDFINNKENEDFPICKINGNDDFKLQCGNHN